MMSGIIKKIPWRRAEHGLTQKVAGFHVRKNKGRDQEPRPVVAQLEHKLDNSRMFLFAKTTSTFGKTRQIESGLKSQAATLIEWQKSKTLATPGAGKQVKQ